MNEEKEKIELGEEILIDHTIWAVVDDIETDKDGRTFMICIDRIGGEHVVSSERVDKHAP